MYSIQKHLQYSAWANGKMAEILRNIDGELWDKEIVSSFPSIRKTLYHVCDAETIWVTRIKGESLTDWPSKSFKGSNEEFLQLFTSTSQQLSDLLADKDAKYAESIITYKNLKGVEFSNPLDEMLFHVVNHGSFHRGQLITMLRQLGVTEFPQTDLIAFLRL